MIVIVWTLSFKKEWVLNEFLLSRTQFLHLFILQRVISKLKPFVGLLQTFILTKCIFIFISLLYVSQFKVAKKNIFMFPSYCIWTTKSLFWKMHIFVNCMSLAEMKPLWIKWLEISFFLLLLEIGYTFKFLHEKLQSDCVKENYFIKITRL